MRSSDNSLGGNYLAWLHRGRRFTGHLVLLIGVRSLSFCKGFTDLKKTYLSLMLIQI